VPSNWIVNSTVRAPGSAASRVRRRPDGAAGSGSVDTLPPASELEHQPEREGGVGEVDALVAAEVVDLGVEELREEIGVVDADLLVEAGRHAGREDVEQELEAAARVPAEGDAAAL